MTRLIKINENGIYMVFALIDDEKIRLIHLGTAPFNEKAMPENAWENGYLVQYQETGYGTEEENIREVYPDAGLYIVRCVITKMKKVENLKSCRNIRVCS